MSEPAPILADVVPIVTSTIPAAIIPEVLPVEVPAPGNPTASTFNKNYIYVGIGVVALALVVYFVYKSRKVKPAVE